MSFRSIQKYSFFGRLFWSLVRPIAIAAARSTQSDVDDRIIEAMDSVMMMDLTELDDKV